jgi:hypothetical protein
MPSSAKSAKLACPERLPAKSFPDGQDTSFEQLAVDHLIKTASPETFPGLDWDPPKGFQQPVIIREIVLDRRKRPRGDTPRDSLAPCALCCPDAPKALKGALVFLPQGECYSWIGHECSSKILGEAQTAQARKVYHEKRLHDAQSESLFADIVEVPRVYAALVNAVKVATHAEDLLKGFGRGAKDVRKALVEELRLHKDLGYYIRRAVQVMDTKTLTLREEIKPVRETLGSLSGSEMLFPSRSKIRQLRQALTGMRELVKQSGDNPEQWVLDNLDNRQSIKEAAQLLQQSKMALTTAARWSRDLASFFSAYNYALIESFCRENKITPTVYATVSGPIFFIRSVGEKGWRATPDLELLRTIRDV